ncbi:MAG: SDR family NAD(P)-dependent oxidoreductase [Anaerolineae bacterium]|nr:SDR family NAD(P)-dependent oxidoreductase [Anaerolineae bacterium]
MKTALIWGASGGIGRALTELLDRRAWTVVGVSRHPDDLADLTPHAIKADVTDAGQVRRAVEMVGRVVPEVDLFVYAAGKITSDRVKHLDADAWHTVLAANLTGAFLTTQASLDVLSSSAHLVYIGAYDERLRLPGLSAYAASKAGLEAFTEVLAKEHRRMRVTLVRPAAVDTAFWDQVSFKLPSGALMPVALAEQILEAYESDHSGTLDL